MGKFFRLYFQAVQGSGHDHKGSVSAFCRLFTELFGEIKELSKVSLTHNLHDPLIIFRSFFLETVRALRFQLMGQISAADHSNLPAAEPGCFLNTLAQDIMAGKSLSGKTDPHNFIICIIMVQKPQRYHSPMIKLRGSLPQSSCRDLSILGLPGQKLYKLCIIGNLDLYLGRAKLSEISFCLCSR